MIDDKLNKEHKVLGDVLQILVDAKFVTVPISLHVSIGACT